MKGSEMYPLFLSPPKCFISSSVLLISVRASWAKKKFSPLLIKKKQNKKNHTSTLHTFRYWFMCIYFSFFKHIFMCSIYTNILSVWESFGSLCFKDSASAVRKKSVFTILKGNCVNIFQHQWSWSAALLLLSHEGSLI